MTESKAKERILLCLVLETWEEQLIGSRSKTASSSSHKSLFSLYLLHRLDPGVPHALSPWIPAFPFQAAGADLQCPCFLFSTAHSWWCVWAGNCVPLTPSLPSALLLSWSFPALSCSCTWSCQPFPALTMGRYGKEALTPKEAAASGWNSFSSSNLPQMLLPGSLLTFLPSVSLNCFPTSVSTKASSFDLWLLSWTIIRTLLLATMWSADLGQMALAFQPGPSFLD